VEAFVDGASAGSVRQALNNAGLYVELGDAELTAGEHTVELRYHGTDRHPGSGGRTTAIGPLILANADPAGEKVSFIPASRASELCGQRLDWIEAGESTQLTAAGSSP
jgi:hypothetical protein